MSLREYLCGVAVVLAVGAGPAHAATPCSPITFPAGQTSVTLQDHVPDFPGRCYRFTAHDGQTANLEISQGDDMNFGLDSVAHDDTSSEALDPKSDTVTDGRTSYRFKTQDRDYRVWVASKKLKGMDLSKIFSLTVTLQ